MSRMNYAIIEKYRASGGPEEGGWYYDRAVVIKLFEYEATAKMCLEELNRNFQSIDGAYTIVETLTEEEFDERDDYGRINWGIPDNAKPGHDYPLACPYYC